MRPAQKRRLRQAILDRDGAACYYCGLSFDLLKLNIPPKGQPGHKKARRHAKMTIEHLVPASQGGRLSLENCVLAHLYCNVAAGDRGLDEKHALRERFREVIAQRSRASADEVPGVEPNPAPV
jgi:5-methylcytosine-specific restriction endonuclease McrA